MVSYTYQFGATKMGTSDAVQVQAIQENQAPKFKDGASTFRVVAENTPRQTPRTMIDTIRRVTLPGQRPQTLMATRTDLHLGRA